MKHGYDVVIVGAGVAGLFTAYELARKGLKVAVIERKPMDRIGEKVCGDAIAKHYFRELEFEEPTLGLDAEGYFRGVKVVSPDEDRVITVYGDGIALNRKEFGQRILRLAMSKGVEIYDNHTFVEAIVENNSVVGVRARNLKHGEVKELRSKVVVDASGAIAVVRRSLPRDWWVSEPIPPEDFNVTYREVWEADIDIDHDFAWIFLNVEIAPGGYWWLFPKRKGLYNVGLGVQWKEEHPNPKHNFEKFIRSKFRRLIGRVVDRGGGLVPTRRPIPCMVWNGFVVVGDAACTANPLHGGGIGSAMLSAKIAAKVITEALEVGRSDITTLWKYHKEYHRVYGAKQASLDVLRMFLQRLTNDHLNFIFRSELVDGSDIYDLGSKGILSTKILNRVLSLMKLASKPSFLLKLHRLKKYMDEAYRIYLEYPEKPDEYLRWRSRERELFNEVKEWLRTAF